MTGLHRRAYQAALGQPGAVFSCPVFVSVSVSAGEDAFCGHSADIFRRLPHGAVQQMILSWFFMVLVVSAVGFEPTTP